jgi:amino acid transporter
MLISPQESGYPIVDVVYATTGSYTATCVLISFLIVLLFFSAVSTVASSSRQIWSFARDKVSFPLRNHQSLKKRKRNKF